MRRLQSRLAKLEMAAARLPKRPDPGLHLFVEELSLDDKRIILNTIRSFKQQTGHPNDQPITTADLDLPPEVRANIKTALQWAKDHQWITKLDRETSGIFWMIRPELGPRFGTIRPEDLDRINVPVFTDTIKQKILDVMARHGRKILHPRPTV